MSLYLQYQRHYIHMRAVVSTIQTAFRLEKQKLAFVFHSLHAVVAQLVEHLHGKLNLPIFSETKKCLPNNG